MDVSRVTLANLGLIVVTVAPVFADGFEVRQANEFSRLVDTNAELTVVAAGLGFAEGPVWDESEGGYLVFSDISRSRTLKWVPGKGVTVLREPTGWGNGNALDARGRLLTCEHHGRRISMAGEEGSVRTLVDRFQGKRLNSPNDVVVQSDGTVWFTDPDYGILHPPKEGPRPAKEQDGNFVYRFDPRSKAIRVVARDFDKPNGLCLSPDEQLLYVTDSGKPKHIRVLTVTPEGEVRNSRVFHEISPGDPDGIKTDVTGHVWACAGDGVQVFSASGELVGKVLLPEAASNLCFGGQDGRQLFITTPSRIYSLTTRTRR